MIPARGHVELGLCLLFEHAERGDAHGDADVLDGGVSGA
jgi:hypothetical protein